MLGFFFVQCKEAGATVNENLKWMNEFFIGYGSEKMAAPKLCMYVWPHCFLKIQYNKCAVAIIWFQN